jgi:hypothetical protein
MPRSMSVVFGLLILGATAILTFWGHRAGAFQDTTEMITKSGPVMRFQSYIVLALLGVILGCVLVIRGAFPRLMTPRKKRK